MNLLKCLFVCLCECTMLPIIACVCQKKHMSPRVCVLKALSLHNTFVFHQANLPI